MAPPPAASRRLARPPAVSTRHLRRPGLPRAGRKSPPGTARLRRDEPPPNARGLGSTHAARAPDRPPGGQRAVQPRKSGSNCSSRTGPLATTSTGSSPSSRSPPAASSAQPRLAWPNGPRPARTACAACHSEPRRGAGQPIVIHDVRGTDRNWRRIDDLRALSTRIRQQTPRE